MKLVGVTDKSCVWITIAMASVSWTMYAESSNQSINSSIIVTSPITLDYKEALWFVLIDQ